MSEPPLEVPPPSGTSDTAAGGSAPRSADARGYRVLARKYRPVTFDQLIGQDTLVRTLTNAVRGGRLAQAYMLTGVRGVGKTTTARLIARALNCIGPDGTGGVTITPCGTCDACRSIMEDRHVDVLEMDAASRTGVNDIREILDGVRYRPTAARFKVYIIDEVHMLSNQAFNALLKTLEEPPDHVTFIFATTEIRKVPVTVLSRCQRFDLRRVEQAVLAEHFAGIAAREGATVAPAALALIARAADGSVRDGLSLLDQAIAHGDGAVDEGQVRHMLGLADRAQVFDLFESLMKGDVAAALEVLAGQYALGADPLVVLQDLLGLAHWLTRGKVVRGQDDDPILPEAERTRGRAMAEGLSMATLTRAWQMLLKGLGEARVAPDPLQAVEMALIRLAYASDLPSPAEAVARLTGGGPRPGPGGSGGSGRGGGPGPGGTGPMDTPAEARATGAAVGPGGGISSRAGGGAAMALRSDPAPHVTPHVNPDAAPAPSPDPDQDSRPAPAGDPASLPPMPATFQAVVDLTRDRREATLAMHLDRDVRLVRFEPGRIDLNLGPGAPRDLPARLQSLLGMWTGRRWTVSISDLPGAPTLHETLQDSVRADPLVKAVLDTFPGATIGVVRTRAVGQDGAAGSGGRDDGGRTGGGGAGGGDDLDDLDASGLDDALLDPEDDPFGEGFSDDDFGDDDP
ncbi:DNA polymerase III subunit gamma/tau [Roseospira visakhapatnamensis]|uniref:DNA polymerase III subunit gamma/tau n=1 Tax=Roseospira visakhapatnamensis TaxID=390880 RepID=A0A7W6RAD7_9PROT|nr:DNA polymerase III subunit gamma/tau [Roseospira visakhapatnamensis]MBB4264481.1 DNA polymerase-3 subunit gamma/tau [Roseospira visakhapatnamensis]